MIRAPFRKGNEPYGKHGKSSVADEPRNGAMKRGQPCGPPVRAAEAGCYFPALIASAIASAATRPEVSARA